MIDFNVSILNASTLLTAVVAIILTYVIVLIPGMMVTGAKPEGIAKALSCYIWKTFGLVLVSVSVLQLSIHIVFQRLPEFSALSSLLLILVVGIGIMVHASRMLVSVDAASAMIPRLIFSHTVEIIGGLIALVSALSLMLNFMITERIDGWEMPVTMGFLGFTMMLAASLHISAKNGKAGKKRR